MTRPYVVSEDIYLLLKYWANANSFVLPQPVFFRFLREEFKLFMLQIFEGFESIPEEELVVGLKDLVDKSGLISVSLDKVYYRSGLALELTRLIDDKIEDIGQGRRARALSLHEQFEKLRNSQLDKIVLVDDVIFSGELLEKVCRLILRMNIQIPLICTGVGIREGVDKLIRNIGSRVYCVRYYNKVIDEICERDFYPGVPFCGRSLVGEENIGAPYIYPFGNPCDWASIPKEQQIPFSKFCIEQSIKLFQEIERSSGKIVRCSDLDRKVILLPQDDTRFVDALQKILKDRF